jgi:hypothetical protein
MNETCEASFSSELLCLLKNNRMLSFDRQHSYKLEEKERKQKEFSSSFHLWRSFVVSSIYDEN